VSAASCLYVGTLRHRRLSGPRDEFHYPLFMPYLDLDELPELFDGSWLWSARHPAPAWFRRADYLGEPTTRLRDAVRALVHERTGADVDGPIRLLAHPRDFGHCFNPVSFYYCHDRAGERLRAVVAEVTNTPWGERHAYVMPVAREAPGAGVLRGRFRKRLHVSPLMAMDLLYDWRLTRPSQRLSVHVASHRRDGERVFEATLSLQRREISPRALRRVLVRYPLLSARLTARIYAHALGLRLRGASYFPHPDRAPVRP
jgi:uncharacterized protein